MQQQSQSIDENVALLALDQLAAIKPVRINAVPPFFRALHTLAVDDAGGGTGLAFRLLAAFDVERVVDVLQRAVVAPPTKVVIHRAARWQVLRDIAPLASGAQQYITPLTTSRMLARRLPPPRLAGGISGSICCHSRPSDRSDSAACRGCSGGGFRSSTYDTSQIGVTRKNHKRFREFNQIS